MSKRVAEGPESPCGGVAARGGQESSSKPAIGALGTGESAAEVSERQAGLTGPIDYEGVVELEFVRRGDRSIAEHAYHRGANRLSASMPHDDPTVPYYFLITMGGGLIEGEHYRTALRVGQGAHGVLTTQTPTYVFKCERGRLTTQDSTLVLEPGSFLEFYQDEVIPYRHAHYRQYTEVDMAADASLILTDGLTAGWSPDGLRFQYGEVGLRTRVRREGRLIYNDYTLCNPGYDPMDHLGFFEGYTNFNSCVIIDPAIDADFINRARRLLAEEQTDGLRFGLSLLDCGGVVLRMLGFDALANHRVERRLVDVFREEYKSCAPLALRKNDHTRSS